MKTTKNELSLAAQRAALNLFNILPGQASGLTADFAHQGFITDFAPSKVQQALLLETFKPVDLVTLFSLSEAKGPLEQLFLKQVLHYLEVYGLDCPGLFQLEVDGGKSAPLRFVKAASLEEIAQKVLRLLTTNAPLGDVAPVCALVRELGLQYKLSEVANRELRIALYDPKKNHALESAEDALRWLIFKASARTLLIKDNATIEALSAFAQKNNEALICEVLKKHEEAFAEVFNRHKRLIVPLKKAGKKAARIVNRVSRKSKTQHVPFVTPTAKTVLARAMRGQPVKLAEVSLTDKFRYLNLIEYKLMGSSVDTFNIRNGKLWTATERKILPRDKLEALRHKVLRALKKDLAPLAGKAILLDEHVDYGLPISRKQVLGNLPFGTAVRVPQDKRLSLGIYWRNEWGARDLDLSAIHLKGERIGWGGVHSYGRDDILFSGDVTSAPRGACEFFTVNPAADVRMGLFVNIFNGEEGAGAEVVLGYPTATDSHNSNETIAESWQDRTLLRERITLVSRQMFLGFLHPDRFVLYTGRMGSRRISSGFQPIVQRGTADFWTVGRLLKSAGIAFDTQAAPGVVYAHDLRYTSFSLDKLEKLFNFGKESSF